MSQAATIRSRISGVQTSLDVDTVSGAMRSRPASCSSASNAAIDG